MTKKKSFVTDNPALQFITQPIQDEEPEALTSEPAEPKQTVKPIRKTPTSNQRYSEPKSRRLQLLITPSLYQRVKQTADASGISVNDYINQILDNETK